MRNMILIFLLILCMAAPVTAQGGLSSVKSNHSVMATADRLESALKEKGMMVFARIDHAEAARQIGQQLRPTLLIIFGSPALDTPLIQRSRTMGIDLPLKVLIWEDATGKVWLTYTPPDDLARRHGITEMENTTRDIQSMLSSMTTAVALP